MVIQTLVKKKKILRKRIARYSIKVAKGLYSQGKLEESMKYQKKHVSIYLFIKTILLYRHFKISHKKDTNNALIVGWIKPCGVELLYYSTGRIYHH